MTQVRNKQRLLRLLKYLYQNTDEEHPVSTNELVNFFTDENANATRKTIKDDIDVLINEGYDIVKIRSYYNAFFMATREFELPELKLMIDAVSSSRFITKEKSDILINKLMGLTSRYEAEKLVRHLYTAGSLKLDNSGIYYIVDQINDAINGEQQITFQYYDYATNKKKVLRHDGEVYSVSPYSLLWDDNHYYMIGYLNKRSAVNVFRVDRITNLKISENKAIQQPTEFNLDEYVRTAFDMYAGNEQEVVLECRNEVMKSVIDHFGEDVESWEVSQTHFRIKVVVSTSPTFYGWLFQFAGNMRPIAPAEVVDEYQNLLKNALIHLSL